MEIERFVSTTICSANWEGLSPDQEKEVGRFSERWRSLDGRSQEKALPRIICEVVFDPDEETISVILVDDQASRSRTTSLSQETPKEYNERRFNLGLGP